MTRDEALKAVLDGKTIQYQNETGAWHDASFLSLAPGGSEKYRVKPEPKKIPLGPEDVPPGSVLRGGSLLFMKWNSVCRVSSKCVVLTAFGAVPWDDLRKDGYEISRDNGKTWHPCWKEEEV